MRFLITREFFKNIPKEKNKQVKSRLKYFYEEISLNKKTIFQAPKGFWVKKIRDNLYEFRVNSGDRVLFEFRNICRPSYGYSDKELVLLSFEKHDNVTLKINRKTKDSLHHKNLDFPSTLKIEKDLKMEFETYEDKETTENIYRKINSKILYEVTSNEHLIELIKNEDKYTYYYLNDEQHSVLNEELPLFLKGSAGSGKTTVAIRKALELEEIGGYKVGYITFTQPLKTKAKEMYEKFRNHEVEKNVDFYSLEELYEKRLKEKPKGDKTFRKFLYEYNPKLPKGIEPLDLYQEIRGIIKGSMGAKGTGNWNRDLTKEMIEKNDYLSLNKKYTIYSEKEREEIYKITETYQDWLYKKGYYDENDLARKISLNKKEVFDFIICDEVQDLTETEIYMLKTLVVGGKNLLLTGDIHQIINPTYFSFSRVKSLFYKDGYSEISLSKNYRSQKKIVDLANKLSDLRGEYIGKLGEDYKEASILEEKDIFYCKKDEELLKQLEDNTTIILVTDDNTKNKMRKKMPKISSKILTVQDVKGLEFDSVVLYNFGGELSSFWKTIFSNRAKANQIYRYYFNLLYVGITRAKKNLLLMEETLESSLLEKLKFNLQLLTIEGKTQLILKSGEADFLKEGKEFLKKNLFLEAINAFEKAGAAKYLEEAKIRLEADKYYNEYGEDSSLKYILENRNPLSKALERHIIIDKIGDYAFDQKDYEKAKKYYEKSKNNEKISEIYEINGELKKSIEYAKKLEDKARLMLLENKLEKNNKAIKIANEIRISSDKKIKEKRYSLFEFESLDEKYIRKKQNKNTDETLVILNKRIGNNKNISEKLKVKSPTKLVIKLNYVEGGEAGIKYLLDNYTSKISIESLVSIIDNPIIINSYIKKFKGKLDLDKLLILACKNNCIKNALKILELGGNLEVRDENNLDLLEIAVGASNDELVKTLINKGISLDKKRSENVINKVIKKDNFNKNMLLYFIDKVDIDYMIPILTSIEVENIDALKILIENNGNLKLLEETKNLLLESMKKNSYEMTKLLIEGGAKLGVDDDEVKITPMKSIIKRESIKEMKLFLKKGYRLSKSEKLFLSFAGNFEMVDFYLKNELGEDYKKKLKQKLAPFKENIMWSYTLREERVFKYNLEVKYNYDKYKVIKRLQKED